MRLSVLAAANPDAFAELVARLRALGVVKLGALVLGPEPPGPREEREKLPSETPEERRHRIMFAASSSMPPFPKKPEASPVVPRPGGARKAGPRGGTR